MKQIQRDLKELAGTLEENAPSANDSGHRWYREEALADLARRDPEISSFYQGHTQKSGTSKPPLTGRSTRPEQTGELRVP